MSHDLLTGAQLAGYRLEEPVGRGGMGVVYRAHDVALERSVALKLLAPALAGDPAFRERFLVESRLAASLDHPNVVPIHDAGEADGQLYLAMRFVEGTDLKRLLHEEGSLPPARAIAICAKVASALDAAHARGLVHRDVKPSNVLIDEAEHAYLADFGLTKRLSEQAPGFDAGLSLGTPSYVAPEQIEGEDVDGRADQYSLACLLHECLTGKPPFERTSEVAVLFAHLEETPSPPEGLEGVLPKAMAKDPADRYDSCAAFVADARRTLGLEPKRVRWPLAIAGIGAALIGAALLAFFLSRGSDPAAPLQAGRLLRIDPASNSVASTATVGKGASAVATDGRRVWVASYDDGTLWQGDIRSGGMTKVAAFGRPYAVTMHSGSAYVAALGPGQFGGNISTFDAVTGGRRGGVDLFACALASGAGSLWAAGCPNAQELDTESSGDIRVKETVVIPYHDPLVASNFREVLSGIAIGAGAIWVTGDPADRRLWRIDPATHRITATVELGFPPGGVAVGGGAVWIPDMLRDRLARIDPRTNRIVATIPVGRGARGVTFGEGSVWVANAIDHTVARVDPQTNDLVATIPLAASPQAVASGGGSLWVVGDAR
jgi:streptogramin lyase